MPTSLLLQEELWSEFSRDEKTVVKNGRSASRLLLVIRPLTKRLEQPDASRLEFQQIPRGWTGQADRFWSLIPIPSTPVGRAYIRDIISMDQLWKDEPVAISSFLTGFYQSGQFFVVVDEFYRTPFELVIFVAFEYFIQYFVDGFREVSVTSLRRNSLMPGSPFR